MPYPPGPIIGVFVYQNDVVVVRSGHALPEREEPNRKPITEFTWESRRRCMFVASNTSVVFRTFIHLTYPREFPGDGVDVKRHLHRFIQELRRHTRGCSYFWCLEFQVRGAPHIHLLIDWPWPRSKDERANIRLWVSGVWYRIVGSGDIRHSRAGTRVEGVRRKDGAKRYMVKYMSKMEQKHVPPEFRNVGRFWGHSRDVAPVPVNYVRTDEVTLRSLLDDWEYLPGVEKPLYRVLYNTASVLRHHLVDKLDTWREKYYTCSESKSEPQAGYEQGGF